MNTHRPSRPKSHAFKMLAILLPIITVLTMLLLVLLLDDGADVLRIFNYRLY